MYLKCLALSLLYNKHTLKVRHYCGFPGVSSFELWFPETCYYKWPYLLCIFQSDLSPSFVSIPILHATLGLSIIPYFTSLNVLPLSTRVNHSY